MTQQPTMTPPAPRMTNSSFFIVAGAGLVLRSSCTKHIRLVASTTAMIVGRRGGLSVPEAELVQTNADEYQGQNGSGDGDECAESNFTFA